MKLIEQANSIIDEYAAKGYDLTLRQIYYQFVSRDLLRNTMQEYKRLGSIINDARLAGLIDWSAIVDRTRNLHKLAHWSSPGEIIAACVNQYRTDKWADQTYRPEVWVEKDALSGVFQGICDELDIPLFACRGYTSQSEMWAAGQRLIAIAENGQIPFILHFGDHDPSGIDMSRDITDRLKMFMDQGGQDLEFGRLALNMEQVDQYDPPPNPTKTTDARAEGYIAKLGDESWELDALDPDVLVALVRDKVLELRNETTWDEACEEEEKQKSKLKKLAKTIDKGK